MEIPALRTEADVEFKAVWGLLTDSPPNGLGYLPDEIRCKDDIREFQIYKGENARQYRPDFLLVMHTIPVIVVEVKKPTEDLKTAFHEARLYATEINATFPNRINPCARVIACNGKQICYGEWDVAEFRTLELTANWHVGHQAKEFEELFSRKKLGATAGEIVAKMVSRPFHNPKSRLGGDNTQSSKLAPNSFGDLLTFEYRHLFDPQTREQRSYVVRNAYVTSRRRERYADPIEKMIESSIRMKSNEYVGIGRSDEPTELMKPIGAARPADRFLLMLVGSVGSGKSTFLEYIRDVKLADQSSRAEFAWISIDMNLAPRDPKLIYTWVAERIIEAIRTFRADLDFDDISILNKVFAAELNQLQKGPLSLIENESKRNETKAAKMLEWMDDKVHFAKSMFRFVIAEHGRSSVLVLDNTDKRDSEAQLLMFEVSRWAFDTFASTIIIAIRDTTFQLFRNVPPLDTIIKDHVFVIEPPRFAEVLRRRISLLMKEIGRSERTFALGGLVATVKDLGEYLDAVLMALTENDQKAARIIMGLAGRDIRKAMEIFLEVCRSGYIKPQTFFTLKVTDQKKIPTHIVINALLRAGYVHYSDKTSYLKNLLLLHPTDLMPTYFSRWAVLLWLAKNLHERGPSGHRGYFGVPNLVSALAPCGFIEDRIYRDIEELANAGLIHSENHDGKITPSTLVRISANGLTHIELIEHTTYLTAISEETWFAEVEDATTISRRMSRRVLRTGFRSPDVIVGLKIMKRVLGEHLSMLSSHHPAIMNLIDLTAMHQSIDAAITWSSAPAP